MDCSGGPYGLIVEGSRGCGCGSECCGSVGLARVTLTYLS